MQWSAAWHKLQCSVSKHKVMLCASHIKQTKNFMHTHRNCMRHWYIYNTLNKYDYCIKCFLCILNSWLIVFFIRSRSYKYGFHGSSWYFCHFGCSILSVSCHTERKACCHFSSWWINCLKPFKHWMKTLWENCQGFDNCHSAEVSILWD